MNISFKKVIIIIFIIVGIFLLYYYGLEKYLAIKYFDKYLVEQGVSEEYIESKNVLKDWKFGGYKMIVHYSNNEGYTYTYHYDITTHKRNEERKYNVVNLYISKDGRVLYNPYNTDVKYPPIN